MPGDLSIQSYLQEWASRFPATRVRINFKKKKGKVKMQKVEVQEEIMSMSVSLSPTPRCPCRSFTTQHWCHHLGQILLDHFHLSWTALAVLMRHPPAQEYFGTLTGGLARDFSQVAQLMEEYAEQFLEEHECPICNFTLLEGPRPKDFFICRKCHKLCHAWCMEQWCQKKSAEMRGKSQEKGCIFCRDQITTI